MSDDTSSEKTEEPTPKKLKELREKGQLPQSKEVVSTSIIFFIFIYFFIFWNYNFETMKSTIVAVFSVPFEPFDKAIDMAFEVVFKTFYLMLLPLIVIVLTSAILGNILQNGVAFSAESIKPDFKKINPVEGFKKIFSQSNFVEFIKSVLKVSVISGLVFYLIYEGAGTLLLSVTCGLNCLVAQFYNMLFKLAGICLLVFLFVAILDIFYQRYDYTKKNRMTKDQVKKDHKETEGDPQIKSKRKEIQRKVMLGENMDDVKNATAVVRNPTHYAVAIRHHKVETPMPVVLAKGTGEKAEKIIELAHYYDIPILENVSLARGLFEQAEPNQPIDVEFIPAVVEVLQWVRDNHPSFKTSEGVVKR